MLKDKININKAGNSMRFESHPRVEPTMSAIKAVNLQA